MENHTLDLSSYDGSHARGRRLLVPTGMMTETSRGAFQSSERMTVLMYVRSATGPSLLLGTVRDQGESTIDATFGEIFISQGFLKSRSDNTMLNVSELNEPLEFICTDSELLASWLLKPAVWFSLTDDSVMNGYACHLHPLVNCSFYRFPSELSFCLQNAPVEVEPFPSSHASATGLIDLFPRFEWLSTNEKDTRRQWLLDPSDTTKRYTLTSFGQIVDHDMPSPDFYRVLNVLKRAKRGAQE
ncbi:hypothetical protein EV421DRAFT_2022399 [Armillaria borealis]|uniref:Uncharacterized protein n=1 Tax=Armillaria borealis TaxID=47425 RepID=A0AA39J5S9_9AGAR|nr:hypothetical protein EV421DRAFT_2022399 [Armillaria borealis]